MTDPELGLVEALKSAQRVAARLANYADRVGSRFPMDRAVIADLDERTSETVDALLFRYANLVALLQEQVFRSVLIVEDIETLGLTNRDVANVVEKLGVIASRERFAAAVVARNRLSHTYPFGDDSLASRMNDVFANIPIVLSALDGAIRHARRRGIDIDGAP